MQFSTVENWIESKTQNKQKSNCLCFDSKPNNNLKLNRIAAVGYDR